MFDEAAEFFFADMLMQAFARGEVFEGFVFHFQSLEMKDEQVLIALIPDLALLQFHGASVVVVAGNGERKEGNTRMQNGGWKMAGRRMRSGFPNNFWIQT